MPLPVLPPSWRLPPLPPRFTSLPGARQRRRALELAALAGVVVLLRPWPPFVWLPGWCVGGLILVASVALLRWRWQPRRWR